MNSATLVQKLWNYCNVLRDDGMSYGDYVEQLTYLLFLKMADERSKPPYNQASLIPKKYAWPSMGADVKGDAYEGLLEKNAQDTKSGAGQYFTPRPLIQAMVDAIAPRLGELVCDPACGTGGFLFTAHNYITQHNPNLTRDEKRDLKETAFRGWELVQGTARVCAMNLLLHGIGSEKNVPIRVSDALAADPGERFEVVLANPPFGKKSSTQIEGADGSAQPRRTSSSATISGPLRRISNSISCSTSRRCSRSMAARRWWCPTTCYLRAVPARLFAKNCCMNAMCTRCCACQRASFMRRA